MSAPGSDAVSVMAWGVRRYGLLFCACLLLGAVVAPIVAARMAPPADADALVIAQRLDTSLPAVPRYGEAVFDNGQVAQALVAKFGDLGPVKDIIPDKVSLTADADSIVFHVTGHDRDPQRAADIANTAADAFVQGLNAPGVGVGAFALQSPADPPAAAPGGLGRLEAVAIGIVGGIMLGLVVVFLVLLVRRPVFDAAGVEEATGVPALGAVRVPRTRRGLFANPEDFSGLAPACRRLLRLPTSTVVLHSRPRQAEVRTQVAVALATVLMRVRAVTFVGPVELGDGEDRIGDGRERLTVVDSDEPFDLMHPPESTAAVLVVREGISSSDLRTAVVEHLGGSAEARVLLVGPGRRVRGEPVPPAAALARPDDDLDVALADRR